MNNHESDVILEFFFQNFSYPATDENKQNGTPIHIHAHTQHRYRDG